MMKGRLRKVVCRHIPTKGYVAMTVLCWMVVREESEWELTDAVINHENIHYAQQKELLFLGFYIIYGLMYAWNFMKTHDRKKAHRSVLFEREAYGNENDMTYLSIRKHYAWAKKQSQL